MDNLVSIILPVYNGENFLKESIDSVLAQTYKNFEFIIINDGSTDRSDLIIREYLINSKIKYISRENKGLVATLNEAILICKGDYIARMDQDDICYPTRVKSQLDFIKKNDIDVCGSSYEIIDESGRIKNIVNAFNEHFEVIISAMLVPFAHPSVMFRNIFKTKGLKYGNKKITFAEDYDLWIKMIQIDLKFGNVDDILLKYRVYGESLSRLTKENIFIEVYNNCENYNKNYKSKLISAYKNILSKEINYSFSQIIVKSVLNFLKSNGYNFIAVKLLLKISFKSLILGFSKFIRQEILHIVYMFSFLKNK